MFFGTTAETSESTLFRDIHSLEERKQEASRMRSKYADRVPVIVEPIQSNGTPPISKKKYLVPKDIVASRLLAVIRKNVALKNEQTLYMFYNETLLPMTTPISKCDDENRSDDGFLYLHYGVENVFG